MDRTINGMRIPKVTSLGAAGTVGRIRVLTTDGKAYYDNGTAWVELISAAGGGFSLGLSLAVATGNSWF